MPPRDPEDDKLVTLARGARGRVGAPEGAAVRDDTGRTYSAASVALPSLAISALRLAVAQAAASGARGLECAVLAADSGAVEPDDLAALRDLGGAGMPVIVVDRRGDDLARLTT